MTTSTVPTLVEPDWLVERLSDPDLRIVDCTAHLRFDPETGERRTESGRSDWAKSHIPGSVHVDVPTDLSEIDDPAYPNQLPTGDRFAAAMGELGIGDDSSVVLYDRIRNNWAARVWWLLRTFGFDNAGVLNGGWKSWVAENRPTTAEPPPIECTTFTPDFRPAAIADSAEVSRAIDDDRSCLVNALRPEDHAGTGLVKYGRSGRIPSSVNVPAAGDRSIVDLESARYLPPEDLRGRFADAGVLEHDRVITYCGSGIAASSAAFALVLVGKENVAVYDGSLAEWGGDPSLPMETD